MKRADNSFFRITKFSLCFTLIAGVGLGPSVALADETPSPTASVTASEADFPSDIAITGQPGGSTEPQESATEEVPEQAPQGDANEQDNYQIEALPSEAQVRSENYSARESDLAVNDATDSRMYAAFTTARKAYYPEPSATAKEIGSWAANTQLSFYHWDSTGKWLTARIGAKQIFFTSDDLDVIPSHDSQDNSAYRFIALRNVTWYEQPSSRSRAVGSFPSGHVAQCRPLDAEGKWYFASTSYRMLFYFKASDIEVLPNWTASDRTAYSGVTIQPTGYYEYPSTRAKALGYWKTGTKLGYVNYSDGWYTAMMGAKRVYFKSASISGLIANDSTDSSVYSAIALKNKNYYSVTSTDSPVKGTWGRGTVLGYFHWDKSGKWLTAFIGDQRIFFTPDGLETLPKRTTSSDKSYALQALSDVPYYSSPSVNSPKIDTFRKGISLGGCVWDGSWMWAYMGSKIVYFQTDHLAYDLAASSLSVGSGLAVDDVPYYSDPNTGSRKLGEFKKGTNLGFVQYDLAGNWYSATMGPKGRVYFQSRSIAQLPKQDHSDRSAHSAIATARVPYYELPSTRSNKIGSFGKGTRLGFMHWDAANQWYWAYMGNKTVYFQPQDLDVLPDRDHSSVAVHLSYALDDVPYYSDVYTKSRKLGVFRKGSMPGFVHYDRGRNWATAITGSGRVYFQTRNLAIIPPHNSNDWAARNAKTTSTVTYYEAPTTRSKALGTWRPGTNLGYFRWTRQISGTGHTRAARRSTSLLHPLSVRFLLRPLLTSLVVR